MNKDDSKKKGFIPPHGGYKRLHSYQKALIIYDGTHYFTSRFFPKYDRTASQMVQAARSGKQNIAEGSIFSGTSKETEIKLTNVARASLEELKLDYEDFLRVRKLSIWNVNDRLSARMSELNKSVKKPTYGTFRRAIEHEDPEICANAMIWLIQVCKYLLTMQLRQLESAFILSGGLRERMLQARLEERQDQDEVNPGFI